MSCLCGCGCCEGIEAITPRVIFNRPGLPALRWRVGEYADFLETMRSRIATVWVDIETGELGAHGEPRKRRMFPLRDLRTRAADDDTLALLDLWAVVGEILSFYTERIAGEGYLRTAGELRSVSELARLVGYRRRPGVAASVFLAFTADDSWKKPLVVPAGARVQSLPEPGEAPVFFETGADLAARALWNVLEPRRTRPTYLPLASAPKARVLYLTGTATRLAPNDLLALSYGDKAASQKLRRVAAIEVDYTAQRTLVSLVCKGQIAPPPPPGIVDPDVLVSQLERPPSVPPATPARLSLSPRQTFGPGSPAADGLLIAFHPAIADGFAQARANATASGPIPLQAVSVFRVIASIYGSLAPLPPADPVIGVAAPAEGDAQDPAPPTDWRYVYPVADEDLKRRTIDLDAVYDGIVPGDWVVVETPGVDDDAALITRVTAVDKVSRTDYHLIAKVTRLTLDDYWLPKVDPHKPLLELADLRSTKVYASPELLPQDEEPIDEAVCGAEIELAGQVDGLQPGRWLIVTGERAVSAAQPGSPGDAFSAPGVSATEVVMLLGVRQSTLRIDGDQVVASASPGKGDLDPLPGDRIHTFLQLTIPLSYCYRRDTLRIYANVAHATHGETHEEPLGSGDPGEAFQSFTLKSSPVTYVSAPTATGVQSSLAVYVNDVRWREAANRLDLGPADRGYLTFADQDEKTTVTFGDGKNGARLPQGVENVRSVYRSGIGAAANVRPGQLSQLVTRTEGLREVVNPARASGGADPEGIESTRARAPLAVAALDRLVATRDYADFALRFAGIGKASAAGLPSSHGHLVHVTVAGEDDIPIDPGSDLQRNLVAALRRFGDPSLPVRVASRELLALVIAAAVKLDADHVWELVRPQLEAALHTCFGFARRELAQDAYAAEAIAAMQAVGGVDYVDLTLFAAVSETATTAEIAALGTTLSGVPQRIPALPARPGPDPLAPLPAQLVALLASPTTTVMLSEIPDA